MHFIKHNNSPLIKPVAQWFPNPTVEFDGCLSEMTRISISHLTEELHSTLWGISETSPAVNNYHYTLNGGGTNKLCDLFGGQLMDDRFVNFVQVEQWTGVLGCPF